MKYSLENKYKVLTKKLLLLPLILCSLLMCFITSCSNDDKDEWEETSKEEIITVEPYKQPYTFGGNDPRKNVMCFVIHRQDGEKVYEETIEGFDKLFQVGIRYTLKVIVKHYEPPYGLWDAFSYDKYTLLDIMKEEHVDEASPQIEGTNNAAFL